jgi:uncharacterized protein (TIGR02246 family)
MTATTSIATDLATDLATMVTARFDHLERAWNAADGSAFGEPFTTDADFVDIRGDHHTGRGAISDGHQALFDRIYLDSLVRFHVESAHQVLAGCVIAVAHARLEVPQGPRRGLHTSRMTVVLVKQDGGWLIRAFHNTLQAAG